MFPFEQVQLRVSDLVRAALRAKVEYQNNIDALLPLQLVTDAITTLEDLILFKLLESTSGLELISFINYQCDVSEVKSFGKLKDRVLGQLMSDPKQANKDKANALLIKFQSSNCSDNRSGLLWANYFYALTSNSSVDLCLNWVHASLTNEYMSDFYRYEDRLSLKKPIDHMTKRVKHNAKGNESFLNRYDAALLAMELNHSSGFERVA